MASRGDIAVTNYNRLTDFIFLLHKITTPRFCFINGVYILGDDNFELFTLLNINKETLDTKIHTVTLDNVINLRCLQNKCTPQTFEYEIKSINTISFQVLPNRYIELKLSYTKRRSFFGSSETTTNTCLIDRYNFCDGADCLRYDVYPESFNMYPTIYGITNTITTFRNSDLTGEVEGYDRRGNELVLHGTVVTWLITCVDSLRDNSSVVIVPITVIELGIVILKNYTGEDMVKNIVETHLDEFSIEGFCTPLLSTRLYVTKSVLNEDDIDVDLRWSPYIPKHFDTPMNRMNLFFSGDINDFIKFTTLKNYLIDIYEKAIISNRRVRDIPKEEFIRCSKIVKKYNDIMKTCLVGDVLKSYKNPFNAYAFGSVMNSIPAFVQANSIIRTSFDGIIAMLNEQHLGKTYTNAMGLIHSDNVNEDGTLDHRLYVVGNAYIYYWNLICNKNGIAEIVEDLTVADEDDVAFIAEDDVAFIAERGSVYDSYTERNAGGTRRKKRTHKYKVNKRKSKRYKY